MVRPIFGRRCSRCLRDWRVAGANVSNSCEPCGACPSSLDTHWYVLNSLTIIYNSQFLGHRCHWLDRRSGAGRLCIDSVYGGCSRAKVWNNSPAACVRIIIITIYVTTHILFLEWLGY